MEQGNCKKCVWFTGLSGSGKSSLAKGLQKRLLDEGIQSIVLDGDVIRKGVNSDLDFSLHDRVENIRRVSEIARMQIDAGILTICAFISPTKEIRDMAKQIIGASDYFEVFVNTPFEVCKERDVKGLYKKAELGEIMDFTGLTSPYEKPTKSDYVIETAGKALNDCIDSVYNSFM